MTQLFKKAAVFTDIHFGKKNSSKQYNVDCFEFVEWMCKNSEDAETLIFVGDWHDNRRFINLLTMHYSIKSLELLSERFENVYLLVGNHDMHYKYTRSVHSLEFAKEYENIHVIDEISTIDDVVFLPFLVEDEHLQVEKLKGKYLFGHLEVPGFRMGPSGVMPDTGKISSKMLKNFEFVFSGHFHNRQMINNILYLGSAFPQNYGDAWDDARGLMILEWDKEPRFYPWPDQPVYRTYNLTDAVDMKFDGMSSKAYAKIIVDVNLKSEEIMFLKELIQNKFKCREIALPMLRFSDLSLEDGEEFDLKQSIDDIVKTCINKIEKRGDTDPALLLSIYEGLIE